MKSSYPDIDMAKQIRALLLSLGRIVLGVVLLISGFFVCGAGLVTFVWSFGLSFAPGGSQRSDIIGMCISIILFAIMISMGIVLIRISIKLLFAVLRTVPSTKGAG